MQGNAFFSMLGLASGAVLNLFLDPLLIFRAGDAIGVGNVRMGFGAGMGVAGAALATGISQVFSFCILAVGMGRSDNVKIRLRNFTPTMYYFKGIFKGGLPSLARQGMASIATASLNHAIGLYLVDPLLIDAAQAAMTGVNRIMMFLSSALIGFGQGFQPVCGFNYGARRYDRVLRSFRYCVRVASVVLVGIAALFFVFARPITNLVAGASPEALDIAAFTFLIQLFQTRNRDGQKAHDNRCVDVRRDAHGEKIHAAECSAAHRVKQRKYTVIRGEILTDDSRIDERTRQCGAKSDEREHQEREDQSLP